MRVKKKIYIDEQRKSLMRGNNEGKYRGGERMTGVTTACPEDR